MRRAMAGIVVSALVLGGVAAEPAWAAPLAGAVERG